MSDIQQKREAMAQSLQAFLGMCDDAETFISKQPVERTPEMDFTSLLDTILPLPMDKDDPKGVGLAQLKSMVSGCTRCKLCQGRTNTVFAEGVTPSRLMVIGEGPGQEEDATGRPFVGRAGKYLDSWLGAINLSREKNVYIANIVKCRPPENRNPEQDEVDACLPFLKRQIQLAKPEMLLLVGGVASKTLLDTTDGVGKLHGRFFRYEGLPVMVTYHPAAVLRNPDLKRPVWEDLKKVAAFLNITLQGRS